MYTDNTMDILLNYKDNLIQLITTAKYDDERRFYTDCLKQVNIDIDIIGKNGHILGENSSNSDIFE